MLVSRYLTSSFLRAQLSLIAGLAHAQDAPECSASIPCTTGCCSKFGFCGLGPDYCSGSVCVNNCDSKAECDPGGYGEEFVVATTCPLNVCCSKYGFCGTTSEFCGTKTVKRPSCSVDQSSRFKRVVGYYESWASGRACNRFYPEQIPSGVYTHINFAFASINPDTYEMVPASSQDINMYSRVADLKNKDSNLKVFIAKAFIDSVLKFLQTYNYDGIDLDWEYPAADDRSGRAEDFANFPRFLKNLKNGLKNYEVSITLPASYWYLQNFDLKNIAPSVDFFNLMTYDFHGVWDMPNIYVGPYLNSHTNLTEIKDGFDLLWRNNIDHDKVTLGLAFYGRGFIATSPNCLEPGCTYESGTAAQTCSAQVGVALNSEIDELVADENLTPVLNEDAAVKILTWEGTNWLTYDDEDTMQLKADFARSECIGGVMVWAISHDTKDAKYSTALSRVAPRLFNSLKDTVYDSGYVTDETDHSQCRWTNCDENCPSNWVRTMRKDSGARDDEFMVNGAGCDGRGVHQLCCPPDGNIPTCGWYSHNNGNCDNGASCPAGTREVGSNSEYCHGVNGGALSVISSYQAACCTTETDNMALYNQCDWSGKYSDTWPSCSEATCNADVVAYSGDGSGDATCWGGWYYKGMADSDKNKYCCDQPDKNKQWSDCNWGGKTDIVNEDTGLHFCTPTCSGGTVPVAMQHAGCSGGSASAMCCKPSYKTFETRYENSEDYEFANALAGFMEEPQCPSNILAGNPLRKRDLTTYDNATGVGELMIRQSKPSDLEWYIYTTLVIAMAQELFTGTPRQSTIAIWNNTILSYFPSLSYASLYDYQTHAGYDTYLIYGSTQWGEYITCNLPILQAAISGDGGGDSGNTGSCISNCVCVRADCCFEDDDECIADSEDGDEDEDDDLSLSKRATDPLYSWRPTDPATGQVVVLDWPDIDYYSASTLNKNSARAKFAEAYDFDPNCANFNPIIVDMLPNGPTGAVSPGFQNDHFLERKMMPLWGDAALLGRLAGNLDDIAPVPFDFFSVTLQQIEPTSGQTYQYLIMDALGSKANLGVMTFVRGAMNNMKEHIWTGLDTTTSAKKMENWVYGTPSQAACPKEALEAVRRAGPSGRFRTILNNVRGFIRQAETLYRNSHNQQSPNALAHFDAWMQTTLEGMKTTLQTWGQDWLENLDIPAINNNPSDRVIRSNLVAAYQSIPDITDNSWYI